MSTLAALTPDICGELEVSYETKSSLTHVFSGGNNEPVTLLPNLLDKAYGTFRVSQIVRLKNYPSVNPLIVQFDAIILAAVKPLIPSKIYEMSGEAFHFSFDPFRVLPSSMNGANIVKSSLDAFILDRGC